MKVGFSLINPVSLQKPTLSTDESGFLSDKPGLSEKPILSARADKDCFTDKLTLSARGDNVSFFQMNQVYQRETHIV